jgi:hypothetical protein
MSKDAPYAGDLAATYRKYHAFAGVPQMPEMAQSTPEIPKRPPTKPIGSGKLLNLVPVECGHCNKNPAIAYDDDSEETNAPIECGYTPASGGGKSGKGGKGGKKMRAPLVGKTLPGFDDIFL